MEDELRGEEGMLMRFLIDEPSTFTRPHSSDRQPISINLNANGTQLELRP